MLTSGVENDHGSCLTATAAAPFVVGPESWSTGTERWVDASRRRGRDAAAIQSADALSWWSFRIGHLGGALPGKLDHPSHRARLRVEAPSATGCASSGACTFTPDHRSALGHSAGHWSAGGSCRGLISTRRHLGGEVASGYTAPRSPPGGSKGSNPSVAESHPTG